MILEVLNIKKGLTSIIGSGGKTSLMYALAKELSDKGKVIICTSTKIYKPDSIPFTENADEITFEKGNVYCIGKLVDNGKITAPDCEFEKLIHIADYVLCEADGSKGLPLKAHADFEPVIPKESVEIIGVLGITGINRKISEVCHRADIYARLSEKDTEDMADCKSAADVIIKESLLNKLVINQAETYEQMKTAEQIAQYLDIPVYAGEVRKGILKCLHL